ncbi:MAG: xanthine dehydrogenase accessory protein XdhC [Burkholderiales bacterium]|nr:xanthine dehydrogenase accessory protein XdhC [Burkholderiales bacterium]
MHQLKPWIWYLIVSSLTELMERLKSEAGVLVTVESTRGSAPREAGTWMAVFATGAVATVGGGRLEYDAMAHARQWLQQGGGDTLVRYSLGPSLGQCCGGEVVLHFQRVGAADREILRQRLAMPQTPVALFGGGHVGRAVVHVLARLPMTLTWIDSRDEIFPADLPANVVCEHSDPLQAAVADLRPGSRVLIMSFSHAEDLDVVAACLARQREKGDLPYVGLIGSKTKWASFRQRLLARGYTEAELVHVTCPIGMPGIPGKEPEVIAVAVAAQILQVSG